MSRIALLSLLVVMGCGPVLKPQYHEAHTATMVFYAPSGPAIIVIVDGFPLGSLSFGKVTRFSVVPGEHTLWAKSEGTFGLTTTGTLAPGEVAYFSYCFPCRNFAQLDEKQFNHMIATDVGRTQGKGSSK